MRLWRALVTVTFRVTTLCHTASTADAARTFDVVSDKPGTEDQQGARLRILQGGRVEFRNTPLT
jgi:hypothetical protein